MGLGPPATPKMVHTKLGQKRDWNWASTWFPPNTHYFIKRRTAPLWPSKIIHFCKSKLKRAWNYAYLARKIQNFLMQGGSALLQPQNGIYIKNFDRKGTEIVHSWFSKITHPFLKRRASPLRPPKFIYFCKFRLKRAWNYHAYLARKIQNFLRQGGMQRKRTLETQKSYISWLHICMNFYRKGTEIVHLWFSKIHILLWKGVLPPFDHQKS